MIVIVWEFRVKAASRADFERVYGPQGDWARLFRRASGYAGTDLLRDASDPLRYLTVDRWYATSDFERFRQQYAREYEEIDQRCAGWTEAETRVGVFEAL